MKKFFTLTMLLCLALCANAQTWDGSTKTEVTPVEGVYHVTTGAELAWIAAQSNGSSAITYAVVLDNDIDLGGHKWTPIGLNNNFNGTFDGQGHTISNILLNPAAGDACCGLFGKTSKSSAYIKNFTLTGNMNLTNAYTASNADYATIVGLANALASIENVHSSVNIDASAGVKCANYLGGITARVKATEIKNCSYSGTITIGSATTFGKGWGGMIGTFNSTTTGAAASVIGCWFDGTISSAATTACTYGGAAIGYANIPTLTMYGNYIAGSMSVATAPKSYGCFIANKASATTLSYGGTATATKHTNFTLTTFASDNTKYRGADFTDAEYHNGTLAYQLNYYVNEKYAAGDKMFGQDLTDASSVPALLVDGTNNVYKTYWWTRETTDLGDGNQYDFHYCNPAVQTPTDPTRTGATFVKWVDKNGAEPTTNISKNTTYYALFKQDVTVSAAGYSTLYLVNYATTIPAGVKAYACHVDGETLVKEEITDIIPGKTPVLIKADEGTYTFNEVYETEDYSGTNELVGVTDEPTAVAYDATTPKYVLQNQSGNVAFYRVTSEGANLHAYRAYLQPAVSSAKEFFAIDGETTGINRVSGFTIQDSGEVYNLSGVRVNSGYKGIVISNGRTFINK